MNKLAQIYLSTKAELSLFKDKLYLLLEFLEFEKGKVNQIVMSVEKIIFNELLDEYELKIEIFIREENENYYLVFEIYTPRAVLYKDKSGDQFDKTILIDSTQENGKCIQTWVLLTISDFYPTSKFLKHAEFILNQLSSNEIIREFEEENHKLRQRLNGLSDELRTLKVKLENRSMFLAYLSHEIRTPMNGILGFTDILLSEGIEPEQADYLNKIKTSGNDLLNLVNDILDFSKLEAGRLAVESIQFNLFKIIEEIDEYFSGLARSKGIDFMIDIQTYKNRTFIGDPLRLKQVLMNLINNAIKFTNEGTVTVRIESTEDQEHFQNLRFVVKDTGIGIRKEVIGKLFSPYIQADDEISRRFGGTGLGLFICKQLVELMGGIIDVKSSPGQGSEFSFVLPYTVDNEFEDENIGFNFKGLKSLVVDSYQISNDAISEILTRAGFVNESLLFSQDAIALFQKSVREKAPFDLVIINYDMPFGPNGAQTAKIIKENSLNEAVKVIVISVYNREQEYIDNKHFDAFVIKPISQSVLLKTVGAIFSNRQETLTLDNVFQTQEEAYDFSGVRILLADDSNISQEFISELVTRKGAYITIVNDGKKAIEKVSTEHFDIILMDINMPEIDGIEASKEISKINKDVNIPIIAITADEKWEIEQENTGIVDSIIKPFAYDELYLKISKWVTGGKPPKYESRVDSANKQSIGVHLQILKNYGIDVDAGLKRVNYKIDVYENLLNIFRKNYFGLKTDFERAIKNGQAIEGKRLIHTVKGASATIGASRLANLAIRFEADLINDRDYKITKSSFFRELEKFMKNTDYLDEIGASNSKKMKSKEEIKKIITALDEAYEYLNHDIGQTITIIDQLVEMNRDSQLYQGLRKIAEIAYSFQMENTRRAITRFINQHKF